MSKILIYMHEKDASELNECIRSIQSQTIKSIDIRTINAKNIAEITVLMSPFYRDWETIHLCRWK